MATILEIKAQGDTAAVVSSPLVEPLNAPLRFEERLKRFGEHYNTNQDSHLYKFLVSLCGDAGAGSLKREKLYPRLQQLLGSTYFQDLDKLYGNPIGISRFPTEVYIFDPHNEALTQEQWIEVFAKDASYRERCLTWMRAIIEGPTPRGIAMAAEAASGIECDIYENYRYIDNMPLSRFGQILLDGGFINDATRADAIGGDGLLTQSSFGVWSSATNLSSQDISNWNVSALASQTAAGGTKSSSESEYKFATSVYETYTTGDSIRLVTSAINQGIHQPITGFTNVVHTLSFWIKRVGASGQIWAGLVGNTTTANLTVTPTTTWTRYSVPWTPAGDSSLNIVFKQLDATATDVYIDGIQVEARPIATPYTVSTRAATDLRLPNPDAHVSSEVGWVAIHFRPSWAASVDNFDNAAQGNDQPHIWSWIGEANTGIIRNYFSTATNSFTLERSDQINPSPKTVSVATSHAANDPITLIATWSGSNIALSLNGGAYTANGTATGLKASHGGSFFIGSNNLADFLQGDVLAVATGKTYQPNVTTIQNQLTASNPAMTDFPVGTTSYWGANDTNYIYTGSDVPLTIINPLSSTSSRNEFVIIPQVSDLDQREIRAINRLVDKLRPVDTIVTVAPGSNIRNEIPILDVTASSTRFTVLRYVTGRSEITWPTLDPAAGYWIDANTNEAPTFAFLDRQEAATYISILDITATSEHTGQYNAFQRSLFSHLNNLNDFMIFNAEKAYAKAIAPLNVTTPWIKSGIQQREKILVNGHYPIGYFTDVNADIAVAENSFDFWSSTEKFAPAVEELIIDLDVTRPFNFLDFNISQKPIDIKIEYLNGTTWEPVVIKEGYEATYSVNYLPSVGNPWAYLEYNFDLITSNKIKITLTRREQNFPEGNSTLHPWSIELQNLRVIHLVRSIEDFIIDSGTDILGNTFETDIFEYEVGNIIDPDESELYSYWQSQPNPTRHAVEALYFDLRDNQTDYTMALLNGIQMNVLDDRSMTNLTDYFTEPVIVDEVFVAPVTHGATMHFYYSNDDTPDWDNKLWIPIPEHYTLRRGYFALPSPTAVRYFKIEFSDLTPVPYQFIEYPTNITTRFRQYPTWVENYFLDLYPTQPYEENIEVVDIIKIDPLKYGYRQYVDALSKGYKDVRTHLFRDTAIEVREFIEDVIAGGRQQRFDTIDVERRINFFSPLMWQMDLISVLNPEGAATRMVQKLINPLIQEQEWSSELPLPTFVPPVQKSMESLADVAAEKSMPIMWFPRAVRHGYKLIEARFDNKVAYHVAISDVKFLRRDMSIKRDEDIYFETLEDEAHITSNSLTRLDSYRWGVA